MISAVGYIYVSGEATPQSEAKANLTSFPYHLVITDMKMETEKSGFQVIKTARESQGDPAIAILTAFPVPGSQWIDTGAHCMLVKPEYPDVLVCQIETLLIRHEDRKQRQARDRGPTTSVKMRLRLATETFLRTSLQEFQAPDSSPGASRCAIYEE